MRLARLIVPAAAALFAVVALLPLAAAAAETDVAELSLADKKAAVEAAPDEVVRMLGGHVMIGYYRAWQLTPLLERGAIGGVFVARRNARRRGMTKLAAELQSFRDVARDNGSRPLWIAADQEGGIVATLSPPLPRQPSLAARLRKAGTAEARRQIAFEYAETQAAGLSQLGVNLNFAPVVDLKPKKKLRRDRRTHLIRRAISDDPDHITEAAATYCNSLAGWRVLCTLKHFPGLQGLTADTHIRPADLKRERIDLESKDWIPFWSLTSLTPAAIMVGHASVTAIDKGQPASVSRAVIGGVLREEWGYDGLVITDDLYMGAIRKRPGGMGKAAVDSLNAGADIVLVTHDGDMVYEVLYALIEAHERGRLDPERLAASRHRLDRLAQRFSPREITWPENFPIPSTAPHRAADAQ